MASRKLPTIGDILRTARHDLRFTQDDFAGELGVSRRTLSRWESDGTTPQVYDVPWIVAQIYKFDHAIGERVAAQLQLPAPSPSPDALQQALAAAAASLGVSSDDLRASLAPLVARWRALECTLDQISASLAPKR